MATLDSLQFEMERRVILFTPITSMPDDTSLGYNGDPNLANPSNSDGEFLLYHSPNSTRYAEFDASQNVLQEWYKEGQPNTWSFLGSGALDTSVGVINVGDGSAGVFLGYDASGNIELRTVSGSGAAIVSESGNQIIISIDASFSGEINYGVNVGIGDASVYVQKVGNALEFRELKGLGSIVVSTSDNLILIDASGGSAGNYDTTLDPSLTMPATVGGYGAGTIVADLSGDSLITMWDNLLFPTANPTLTGPSGSFAMSPTTTLYEVEDTATLTFTTTLNRGSISPQYNADSPYRSGLPNNFDFTGTGLVDASSSSIPYVHAPIDVSILIGNQSWSAAIGYNGGVQSYNNKGVEYDSSLAAGSLSASPTRTIEGVYPLFATTSTITILTKQTLLSMSTGTTPGYTLIAETGGNKQKFDIPDKWTGAPTSNPLIGVQQYNTFSSTWEYPGGSAAASLLVWNTSATTQTIQSVVENYTRYTYNGTDRSSVQIRLIF